MALWICPACGRRVPGYAATCHCGRQRESSTPVATAPAARAAVPRPGARPGLFDWRDLTWQVWLSLGLIAILAVVGIWQVLRPIPRPKLLPILAIIDPVPMPTPTPKSNRPAPSPR